MDGPLAQAPLSLGQATAQLTAPGAPFEMDEVAIRGVATRVWKATPASLRDVLASSRGFDRDDFIIYEGERVSFGEHYAKVAALAWALKEDFEVCKGDRVVIAMRNYPEWSLAFFAAAAIGAIVVPLNAWWSADELCYGIGDAGAKVLIADGERLERLAGNRDALRLHHLIAARDDEERFGAATIASVSAPFAGPDDVPDVTLEADDPATIFYTSGTSGRPKGALGSQRNICTNLVNLAYCRARADLCAGVLPAALGGETRRHATLLSVPLFHATGCHSVLLASAAGGHKVVLMRKWDVDGALDLIEAERITSVGGVPAVAWQLLEAAAFEKRDTSSIASVSYGGAPSAPALVERIAEKLPAAAPSNGYGMTETSSVTTLNIGAHYVAKPDSAGPAVATCDLKLTGEDGRELPAGEVGELWIKGPNVIIGYWNQAEATAETFVDGWVRTGDVARLDEEGFLFIVDRTKDMLIRGGENIYCVEVEDALYAHRDVMDAAVVGLPHPVLGEEVGAVVQIRPGGEADEAALKAHVAARLAKFKVPVRIELRPEPLPRNANGKILKSQLRAELAGT